ncbi:ICE2-domain-containing protein [Dissoconium aciculare CBS 342.82]|uniref:ICE2-domain-containing protein n=1 Tax=Dissoconium aciculare CBS 342.82 TaxID=1314786 RepID=A0A6J3LPG3_9PEZI|nr:ICE2-domain-containing protein [Dissoconium aciculare CBS 342.82]KAF1817770.1 ICE2-domain-containing protein [Dissoconium aciculare CBS 342.82]
MIIRALSSALFLFAIVFTIPLAFDVGGRTCGLAFSLSLATYYFFVSCLRLSVPAHSTWRGAIVRFLSSLQTIVIPALLIWSLNKFSEESIDEGNNWVTRAFFNATKPLHRSPSLREWLFGKEGLVENVILGSWDNLLRYSTPVFQLTEGFCSLLLVQAAGQVTRYLVNTSDAGDSWMIGLLIVSGSIISSSVYFLWRISTFPALDSQDAILIGIAITCAFFLCAWGIGSGRGNVVESSLLFAYVTLCIYQIFTDYQPSHPLEDLPAAEPGFPPLPPIFMASYSTILQALSSLPTALRSAFGFVFAAVQTVTPSVIISLIYRLVVLYAAARIIPAVRESGARALAEDPSLEDSLSTSDTLVGLISYFSPSILIAVYTSLLMQHFSTAATDHPGEWWTSQGGEGGGNIIRWINLAGTMALYAVELWISKGADDGLTGHWKLD